MDLHELCDAIDAAAAERAWLEDYKKLSYSFQYHVTGSTVIVGSGRDFDVVILDEGGENLRGQLALLGYQYCRDPTYIGDFTTMRKGDVHAIVVTSGAVYRAWEFATLACSGIGGLLNFGSVLAEKGNRCKVFKWLMTWYIAHG